MNQFAIAALTSPIKSLVQQLNGLIRCRPQLFVNRRSRGIHFEAVFMMKAAWRLSEILKLEWRNVDLKAGEVRLDRGRPRTGRAGSFRSRSSCGSCSKGCTRSAQA